MPKALSLALSLGLNRREAMFLARLNTPEKIQKFVTSLPANFEQGGETCLSVREVLRQRRAHCIEGAMLAALALWMQGRPPLLLDLKARADDSDHVVALYQEGRSWGAISKSNHIWLRGRDPIYRSMRELSLSYFHEYTMGRMKTLKSYSRPFDLRRVDSTLWVTNKDSCWDLVEVLDQSKHYALLSKAEIKRLQPRDALEMKANKLLQFKKPKK